MKEGRLLLVAAAFFLFVVPSAHGLNLQKEILGMWYEVGGPETTEFFKDGTISVVHPQKGAMAGNYKFIDDDRIRVEFGGIGALGGPQVVKVSLSKGQLVLTDSTGEVIGTYQRTKSEKKIDPRRNQILGKWYKTDGNEMLEFLSDGTLNVSQPGEIVKSGSYLFLDDKRIRMDFPLYQIFTGPLIVNISISGNLLILTYPGKPPDKYGRTKIVEKTDIQEQGKGKIDVTFPNEGLVAYYPLNGNANDDSRNGNQGTLYGGVNFTKGIRGQAAQFDGTSGYILVPDSPSLRLKTFTIAASVKPNAKVGGNRIVEKGASNSYWLDINPNAKALVGFYDGNYHDLSSVASIIANNWYFIAGSYDGNILRIFINGTLNNALATNSVPYQTDQPLLIGWKYNGIVDDHFSGLIDEIRIYNRALTEAEVRALYLGISHFEKAGGQK